MKSIACMARIMRGVVESEVRSLAQRSADAAKEINELIMASTQQVESCARSIAAGRRGTEARRSAKTGSARRACHERKSGAETNAV